MNLLDKCEGYSESIFNLYKGSIRYEYDKEYKGVYYTIFTRYKNNIQKKNKRPVDNNERIKIIIDSDLSKDFNHTHYFDDDSSITISLKEVDQPLFGKTKLAIYVEYINQEQELYRNIKIAYCDTLTGTVKKRIDFYKQAFIEEVKKIITNISSNGFSVDSYIHMQNIYEYLNSNKKITNISCDIYYNTLIIFSILNNDCFENVLNGLMFRLRDNYLHERLFYSNTKVELNHKIKEIVDYLFIVCINKDYYIKKIKEKCYGDSYLTNFLYDKFKQDFLETDMFKTIIKELNI